MFRFEDNDPRYLIAYEDEHEHSIAPYQELVRRWVNRFERGDRFGVVLVREDDHEHERDVAFEEAFTKLLNDFRRDHKADVERCTVGFVSVVPKHWLLEQTAANPNFLEEARIGTDRMARYMWGVPGTLCDSVDEARAWLDAQLIAQPSLPAAPETAAPASQRVGLFYGSTTGVTEAAALAIQEVWAAHGMEPISAINIGTVKDLSALLAYDYLILGVPTWNVGQMQDDWEIALSQLESLDFTGKQVALFGVGDQYGYPENYLDAVGMLGEKFVARGAALVGYWNDGLYEFAESKAFVDGKFMGLALDDVHQAEHSDRRINQWVKQIISEFALQPASYTV